MKTDNSKLAEKLTIRQELIDKIQQDSISVLELYAGKSVMWNILKKNNPHKQINLLSIEKIKGKNPNALEGDNIKFIDNINLSRFDIIDIDAYGIPARQICKIHQKSYKGYVVITAIQSMMGNIPHIILQKNGLTKQMIKQCPMLFSQDGFNYIKNFLYDLGCKKICGYFDQRKYYFYTKFE